MHIDEWLAKLAEEEQEKQAAAELESLFEHMSVEDVLKIAASDEPEKTAAEGDVKPSWWAGQKAQSRAMRAGDKGVKKYLASNELVGKRMKGMVGGGALGAGGGALLGHVSGRPGGKALGAAVGGLLGMAAGAGRAEKDYLKSKGIKQRWGGLASPHMSSEAAKKYLKEHEGRKKVAFVTKIARQVAREHVELEKQAVIGPMVDIGNLGIPSAIGYHLGKKEGRERARHGEGMGSGSTAAKLLVPGAIGYRMGVKKGYRKTKRREMTKEDAFTSPEAQQKAKVMQRAMKASKGAPPNVMRSAIKMTGKQMRAV